jgi:hypothetical protein
LIAVLLKSLAPDPARRYARGRDLARELRLCLRPNVRRLLFPEQRGWAAFAHRFGGPLMVCSALLANASITLPIVVFVYRFVVQKLGDSAVKMFLNKQLLAIDTLFYSSGAVLGIWLSWPVLRAFYRQPAAEKLPALRRRSLYIGDWIFWMVTVLWPLGGLTFPLWLHMSGSALGPHDYGQFLVSHLLSGLAAGMLCFFFVTYFSVVHVYARFVTAEPPDTCGPQRLAALRQRVGIYERLSLLVPFLAATSLGFAQLGLRAVYGWLALAGAAAFVVSTLMSRIICRDIDALIEATSPDLYGKVERPPAMSRAKSDRPSP